tara:strand:+ start:2461 stop:2760 length:300 start_codon:yes stop_codon:yes gene_type:complete
MVYKIKALGFFKDQVSNLSKESRKLIYDKIELIKQNPYRFKRIRSKQFSKVFRVRFSIERKEVRLIYVVLSSNIVLVCILDRDRDYKDLEKYLKKVRGS